MVRPWGPARSACATPLPAGRATRLPARTGCSSSASPSSSTPSPSSTTKSSSMAEWQWGGADPAAGATRGWVRAVWGRLGGRRGRGVVQGGVARAERAAEEAHPGVDGAPGDRPRLHLGHDEGGVRARIGLLGDLARTRPLGLELVLVARDVLEDHPADPRRVDTREAHRLV